MNYAQWINYLNEVPMFSKKAGLENITKLMDLLQNPQEKLKIIHVAGTNGKGSVCAMLNSILIEEGYNVGMFTSPHLIRYNERIKVNNTPISDGSFVSIGKKVLSAINRMVQDGYNHPTFFEIITACAFLYFYESQVDFAIIEVGLGGRLDATNVISSPLLSVITPISLDHTSILGNSIEMICEEKCGIIKKNRPVVLYSVNNTVYNIVNEFVHNRNSHLYYIDNSINISMINRNLKGQVFSIYTKYYGYDLLELNLLGDYQIINSAIVLLIIHVLKNENITISEQSVINGLKKADWAGRMEHINIDDINYILDGAHNIDGMKNFLNSISEITNSPLNFIIGFNKDKDFDKMIDLVLQYDKINNIYFTSVNSSRSLKANEVINKSEKIKYINSLEEVMENINNNIKKGEFVCCVGSLYLVGEMRKILLER